MNSKVVSKIVLTALFAALAYVATSIIRVPTVGTQGYVNIGDSIVLLSAWLIGGVYGALAAGIGSALADLLAQYVTYVPGTFIIKFLMALVAYLIFTALKKTNIKEIIFDIRKESNPCSLCAKMRRGALNDMAIENSCNKVALGHHNDDVLETFFLSLMHEGRIHCFSPVTYLDRTDMYQIRPMIYVRERDIRGVVKNYDIPVVHNPCPADGYTQRQYMKDLIKRLEKEMYPGLRKRLFRAIQDSAIDGWSDYTK